MNVLVLGKNSQIGKELLALKKPLNLKFFYTSSEDLNIINQNHIKNYIDKVKPSVIINFAAYTDVDGAESDEENAFLINSLAPEFISSIANEKNIYFINISTDYVFDGEISRPYDISDLTSPVNIYGKSKLDGELRILKNNKKSIIIRASSIFSVHNKNFVKTIFNKLISGENLNVVNDQKISMTFAGDLAQMVLSLLNFRKLEKFLNEEETRIIHYSNVGYTSWYEVALLIKKSISSEVKINPISSISRYSRALRPKDSRLKLNSSLLSLLSIKSYDWKDRVIKVTRDLNS